MRLESVVIEGFRKYVEPFELNFDEGLTAIVGRNDAGKSTVLEALNIFFGNAKLESSDFSVAGDGIVRITAMFTDLPGELILDADHTTDLRSEYLLDGHGKLRLRKSWTRPGIAPTVHALARHPCQLDDEEFLINAKIAKLRPLAADLDVADRRVASNLRKAILEDRISRGAAFIDAAVPLTSDDGKAVASALEQYLPEYHLFRADRTGSESDSLAQDPAKAAIKFVLSEHEGELAALSTQVVSEIRTLLSRVVDKLHEVDPALAGRLSVSELAPDWSKAFSNLRFEDDHGVALAKRGNGTRRLVLLSFFRATVESAEADESSGRSVITAIEEPETALHPDLQRDLMRSIQELAANPRYQAVITTHSSNLVRDLPATALRYITEASTGGSVCVSVAADGDPAPLLRELNSSLGILTDHSVRCFLMVEGRNDIDGLRALSRGLSLLSGSWVADFAVLEGQGALCILPIGGCGSLPLWEDTLVPLSRPQFCVVDSDRKQPGDALNDEVQKIMEKARDGRSVTALQRRELENYLSLESVLAVYSDISGFEPSFTAAVQDRDWDYVDIPATCARVVYDLAKDGTWDKLDAEKQGKKESKAKRRLALAFGHRSVAEALMKSSPDLLETLRQVTNAAALQAADA